MTLIIAKSKFIAASPRKLRLVANAVKALSPSVASDHLNSFPGFSATPILKTLKQALANASHNLRLDQKTLIIKNILVDEGRRRRKIDKSHGSRFDRGVILKRSAHVTVILETPTEQPKEKPVTKKGKEAPKES